MLRASQYRRPVNVPFHQGGKLQLRGKAIVKIHVDYETAKALGQEMSAPVNRGLYLVSLTRAEYDELRERQ